MSVWTRDDGKRFESEEEARDDALTWFDRDDLINWVRETIDMDDLFNWLFKNNDFLDDFADTIDLAQERMFNEFYMEEEEDEEEDKPTD